MAEEKEEIGRGGVYRVSAITSYRPRAMWRPPTMTTSRGKASGVTNSRNTILCEKRRKKRKEKEEHGGKRGQKKRQRQHLGDVL